MPRSDVWSMSLGRWWGVQVRLHMFFLLFATFTMYLAWHDTQGSDLMWLATLAAATLLFSVVVHEVSHLLAARKMGGYADTIVLGPLGGLHPVRVPHSPHAELWAVLAGPAASIAICIGCFLLVSLEEQRFSFGLLQPLAPSNLISDAVGGSVFSFGTLVRLLCWVNWWLVVVNLIPAFPFDGGRACLALVRILRPGIDSHSAVSIVALIARVVAIGLLTFAFLVNDTFATSSVPSWLPLVLLAIFVFFSARKEELQSEPMDDEDVVFGYDFSQGYTSLERRDDQPPLQTGPVSRWMDNMREKRAQQRQAVEAAEDRQVDEILERLHKQGMENLTAEERSLLRRVSARYRSRESH